MKIKIIVGQLALDAELNDTATAQKVADILSPSADPLIHGVMSYLPLCGITGPKAASSGGTHATS
jgi:hypothetical protein